MTYRIPDNHRKDAPPFIIKHVAGNMKLKKNLTGKKNFWILFENFEICLILCPPSLYFHPLPYAFSDSLRQTGEELVFIKISVDDEKTRLPYFLPYFLKRKLVVR